MAQLLGHSQPTKSCADNCDVWSITHEHFSLCHHLRALMVLDSGSLLLVKTLAVPLDADFSRIDGLASLFSPFQPFRFGRTARNQHGADGAGCARHYDLVRHSLIGSKRSFRGKQIRSDVRVLVRRTRGRLRIRLVEDT